MCWSLIQGHISEFKDFQKWCFFFFYSLQNLKEAMAAAKERFSFTSIVKCQVFEVSRSKVKATNLYQLSGAKTWSRNAQKIKLPRSNNTYHAGKRAIKQNCTGDLIKQTHDIKERNWFRAQCCLAKIVGVHSCGINFQLLWPHKSIKIIQNTQAIYLVTLAYHKES